MVSLLKIMTYPPEAIQALSALKQLPLLSPEQFPRPSCQTLIFHEKDQGGTQHIHFTPLLEMLNSYELPQSETHTQGNNQNQDEPHLIEIHVVDSNAKSARVHVQAQLGDGLSWQVDGASKQLAKCARPGPQHLEAMYHQQSALNQIF